MSKTATISIHNVVGYLSHRRALKARVDRMFSRHVAACKTLGQEITPYARFAWEIITAPRIAQDGMLSPEPPPPYQSARSYRQYETPKQEQFARPKQGRPQAP